jgi:RNA polymerase sigma-70 factor (ECF subfamily)
MDRSDAELVAAARDGDRAAVEQLLARYEPNIYRFGLRMCGNEDAAREVLQETLLAAFRYLPGFRGDASLSTWLYQIARSFCIKTRRGQRPTDSIDDVKSAELVDPTPAPDARAHAREIGEALTRAIETLPADQREVLILRDVEGLSAEEAAEVVGVEIGALKSRLHRARMALRSQLAGVLGAGQDAEPCPGLAHELTAYVGAEIDQSTCVQIENHLKTCTRCAGACDALKRTVSMCRRLPGDVVPPKVRDAVRGAILAAIGTPPPAAR